MLKSIFLGISFLLMINFNVLAQKADGTVESIIRTEEQFIKSVKNKGINKSFYKFSDKEGVTFRPDVVKLKKFYDKKELPGFHYLTWQPQYAMISKKGDLGFTTGSYEFSDGDVLDYGHYLSIWKNIYDKWKLVLDIGIIHQKTEIESVKEFFNPADDKYPRFIGPKKIQMREDIVFNTDILLGKSFKKNKNRDIKEFYDPRVRLYFPQNIPAVGKENSLNLIAKQKLVFENSTPTFVDRSLSGDLAYTYGEASISGRKYSYVRVWKLSSEMKWNIILDVYNNK